jgi:hypothetical protein
MDDAPSSAGRPHRTEQERQDQPATEPGLRHLADLARQLSILDEVSPFG